MTSINDVYGSNADYLKAADLQGRQVPVVIAGFEIVDFDEGSKVVLSFQGKSKTLVCNKTNAITIGDMFGHELDGWTGKSITLFPAKTTFGGKMVDCIRVTGVATPPPEVKPAHSPIETAEEIPF